MKFKYGVILLFALVAGVIFWPTPQARAQDEMTVEWANPDGTVKVNALLNAIRGDTVAGGARANPNRVYKLKKGGFYWITERIENKGFTLRIVGEEPGPTALDNPAVIQMVPRADGSVDGRIITGQSSVTLKNLWLTGRDYNGVQTYYQPIQMDASNSRFIIDNCVLEQTNFALIAWTGKNNDIFYTNCKFRNLIGQPSTQQWEGRGISIWADQDTIIVENCTFFNVGMTPFQLEGGAARYIRFNHNTIVNSGRQINTGNWFREAYFANNLCINVWWHGEGAVDMANNLRNDRRAIHSGLYSIGALPSQYGPEQGRRIVFANTAAYLDPKFTAFYADTIKRAWFISPITREDFIKKYGPAMTIKDTTWLTALPAGFTYPPADPNWTKGSPGTTMIDSMISNIMKLRAGKTPATPYFYKPTEYPTDVSWPLPENFAYTDAALMTKGTDGLPLGDLNWFPTQKAQWEANKEKHIADIEAIAGPKKELKVVAAAEAEAGNLSGTATISTFQGFSYFQMDGGGFMEWTFDLAAGGQYDLNIWTHMRNNNMRGQHTYINGVEIHDAAHGWGELIYDNASGVTAGMPINQWTWVRWTQADIKEAGALTFKQGQNVIRISSSWGWQNFAGIDLLVPGTNTVVKSLRAPDVTAYEIVMPKAEGAKFVPNGFKSVLLGTNGTITWNMTAPAAGTYRLNVFYQNPGGSQTGQIKVDGATVVSNLALASKPDSTGTNVLSDGFSMTAGSHTIALSGSQVNVDYVQLIQEIVSLVSERKDLPLGYALAQNYPNPFNPTTTIDFALAKPSHVKLMVYNVLGQKVATLVDRRMLAGAHTVEFDASHLTSGVYFYRLEAGDFVSQKRMLLIK
ncbi:MAG: T9SS type A sorting domain-containing protein [candidate division KSB1 bacterium]|nr:T9SS type A sorting domain-containing protein [candidate division KSB1 bacterium]MDZ7305243.1 T9SS type A sorting domain-containing protein [candidate division KSB1 bacterium]MDZ7310661.1 T9SS type A sorting domain-containing protein [candidate division KSB1 bacterium]